MKKNSRMLFVIIMLIAVSACQKGEVKEVLGLVKDTPDEFMVLSRPPLNVPPNFELVKPAQKKELYVSNKVRSGARAVVTGSHSVAENTEKSQGESLLLKKFNIQTDANIRNILMEEYALQKEEEDSFVGSIRQAIQSVNNDVDPEILDAKKEQERLNKNAQESLQ